MNSTNSSEDTIDEIWWLEILNTALTLIFIGDRTGMFL